jgi:hypothetical protein
MSLSDSSISSPSLSQLCAKRIVKSYSPGKLHAVRFFVFIQYPREQVLQLPHPLEILANRARFVHRFPELVQLWTIRVWPYAIDSKLVDEILLGIELIIQFPA